MKVLNKKKVMELQYIMIFEDFVGKKLSRLVIESIAFGFSICIGIGLASVSLMVV